MPRLDDPPLRQWELNETHTRYDYARSVPSDSDLHLQFALLATINAVVATSCLLLLLSILRSPKVRSNPFNCYLVSILIPDFLSSSMCSLTCGLSAPGESYYSEAMCGWQSFYLTWGFSSNCWLNGVIACQLHKMLRQSHIRMRFCPPTRRRVALHAMLVYLYSAFLGFLGVWKIRWLPHRTGAYRGLACFPMEYSLGSTLFYWLFFIPAFLLAPIFYLAWASFDIYKKNMLPPTGRRRQLALYFARLVVVYLFMWLPFLVICTIGNTTKINSWVFWAGASWSHLQGLVSALVSLTKPDIKNAVVTFLCCRRGHVNEVSTSTHRMGTKKDPRRRTYRFSFMESMLSYVSKNNSQQTATADIAAEDAAVSVTIPAESTQVSVPEEDLIESMYDVEPPRALRRNSSQKVSAQRNVVPNDKMTEEDLGKFNIEKGRRWGKEEVAALEQTNVMRALNVDENAPNSNEFQENRASNSGTL